MSRLRALVADCRAAAAAEMALVAPLMLAIMFGFAELGNYFWSEHVLIKSVRDGAIYASRQRIDNFNCATGVVNSTVVNNTKELVRTGALSGASPLLSNWSNAGATFTMNVACVTSANGTTLGGIYTGNAGNVPVLTITASVPHTSMFGIKAGLVVNARQQAAVMGG